jgi:hypothetical protein
MKKAKPDDVMKITFHVKQDEKPVTKEVKMTRQNFIEYTSKSYKKWAEMYEAIVKDKAYISITDLTNSN